MRSRARPRVSIPRGVFRRGILLSMVLALLDAQNTTLFDFADGLSLAVHVECI